MSASISCALAPLGRAKPCLIYPLANVPLTDPTLMLTWLPLAAITVHTQVRVELIAFAIIYAVV